MSLLDNSSTLVRLAGEVGRNKCLTLLLTAKDNTLNDLKKELEKSNKPPTSENIEFVKAVVIQVLNNMNNEFNVKTPAKPEKDVDQLFPEEYSHGNGEFFGRDFLPTQDEVEEEPPPSEFGVGQDDFPACAEEIAALLVKHNRLR